MEENLKKAFDFAADSTKQLLTLATAIITITVTFTKDILQSVSPDVKGLLTWSWISFLVSIGCGIWTLLALTGTLDQSRSKTQVPLSITGSNVRIPSVLQILSFLVGIGLTVIFGVKAL